MTDPEAPGSARVSDLKTEKVSRSRILNLESGLFLGISKKETALTILRNRKRLFRDSLDRAKIQLAGPQHRDGFHLDEIIAAGDEEVG